MRIYTGQTRYSPFAEHLLHDVTCGGARVRWDLQPRLVTEDALFHHAELEQCYLQAASARVSR